MSLVEIQHVGKHYGGLLALNDITLQLHGGKIIGLLGPNGSGKTTLLKIMNGLLTPDFGWVLIDGQHIGPDTKASVAYLPDRNALPEYMTTKELVKMYQDFFADFDKQRAELMIHDLGLNMSQTLKSMPKGTKEKLQLILTMSRRAKVYMLDEPIGGVDPATRDYILQTIISNYNPEAIVLISTHLISDIEQVLDEVIFLQYGHLVLHDTVANIRETQGKSVDELFREIFRYHKSELYV